MTLPTLPELIETAVDIANHIKADLDDRWYATSGIELCVRWIQTTDLKATASVSPSLETVDRHIISISYGLVEQIYEIAFEFARFSVGRPGQDLSTGIHSLPEQFDLFQAADLMFMAGVMFVIYHETGHLNQSHGLIRANYGNGSTSSMIEEFEVAGEAAISGEQAAISHATEFAADFEALDWMAIHLEVFKGKDYLDHAYLQCAIVSCLMLLFNGDRPVRLDAEPLGTHPYPAPRMDCWVQQFAERTHLLSDHLQVAESKQDIVKFFSDASFMAILSWLNRGQVMDEPEYTDFCKGSSSHPNHASYMRHVIDTWSRHDEQARDARRYGGALSVLYFTDEFRELMGAVSNREPYKVYVEKALKALKALKAIT